MDISLWEGDSNVVLFKLSPNHKMEIARNIKTLKGVRNHANNSKSKEKSPKLIKRTKGAVTLLTLGIASLIT